MSTILLPTGSITTGTLTTLLTSSSPPEITNDSPTTNADALSSLSSPPPPSMTTTSRIRSQDPNSNPGYDFFNTGPSMYLYGFLATLALIFLVSIIVAWRGYYTRRILRRRIEEAIARGVHIPGYTDAATLGRNGRGGEGGAALGPRPVLWETWIVRNGEKKSDGDEALLQNHEVGREGGIVEEKIQPNGDLERGWDFKPASITILRPLTEEEEEEQAEKKPPSKEGRRRRNRSARTMQSQSESAQSTSRFHWITEPLREYWFVRPPNGATAQQLAGMPSDDTTNNTNTPNNVSNTTQNISSSNTSASNVVKANGTTGTKKGTNEKEKRETGLDERVEMAEGVSMSVLILMPSSVSPSYQGGMRASGEGSSKRTSMVSDLEHRNGSRSTSRVGETVEDEGELPELVLGFAE
ncbi:hypothetical protein FRB91_006834, partial [Serendipita sp. 411]